MASSLSIIICCKANLLSFIFFFIFYFFHVTMHGKPLETSPPLTGGNQGKLFAKTIIHLTQQGHRVLAYHI